MKPTVSALLFILILASVFLASFGDGNRKLFANPKVQVRATGEVSFKKGSYKGFGHNKQTFANHPRNLAVKTNDYQRYDPTPSLGNPPSMLIPH